MKEVPRMARFEIVVGRNHYRVNGAEYAWECWRQIVAALEMVDMDMVAYMIDLEEDEIIAEIGEP